MNTRDEQFLEDEREWQEQLRAAEEAARQQFDKEEQEYRLTEILQRLAEGIPITKEQVAILCLGCGIDKGNVF